MRTFIRTGVMAGLLLLGAACAMPENRGMTSMRPDAMPMERAHAICWERGQGAPGGGGGADSARDRAYAACMREMGWEDQRTMF